MNNTAKCKLHNIYILLMYLIICIIQFLYNNSHRCLYSIQMNWIYSYLQVLGIFVTHPAESLLNSNIEICMVCKWIKYIHTNGCFALWACAQLEVTITIIIMIWIALNVQWYTLNVLFDLIYICGMYVNNNLLSHFKAHIFYLKTYLNFLYKCLYGISMNYGLILFIWNFILNFEIGICIEYKPYVELLIWLQNYIIMLDLCLCIYSSSQYVWPSLPKIFIRFRSQCSI